MPGKRCPEILERGLIGCPSVMAVLSCRMDVATAELRTAVLEGGIDFETAYEKTYDWLKTYIGLTQKGCGDA